MTGIYKITSPDNKVYIGQSRNTHKRRIAYKNNFCKDHRLLHASICEFGFENHKFQIVYELPKDVSQDVLNQYESLFIDAYKCGAVELLNIREGGTNGKLSEETRKRMSQAQSGKTLSLEHKLKISSSHKGLKVSDKTKQLLRELNTGKIPSNETRMKMSKSQRERKRKI